MRPEISLDQFDISQAKKGDLNAFEALVKRYQAALHSLPEDQKTVFILKTYENMSYQEIALVTGWKMGTVMSRLNRARKKLRQDLAAYLGGKK